MTIAIQPQDAVRNHLTRVERASFGDYAESILAAEDAKAAQMEIARGNKLFPLTTAFYVRGAALGDLEQNQANLAARVHQVHSLLLSNNIRPILERDDLVSLDSYIRNLPMAYDHAFDRQETRRSRLVFARHIANLLPLYGRSTGTGKPGMLFFNRGGEPVQFDPIAEWKECPKKPKKSKMRAGRMQSKPVAAILILAIMRCGSIPPGHQNRGEAVMGSPAGNCL